MPTGVIRSYIPSIKGQSDMGLQLNVLQQYIFVPLDVFRKNLAKYRIRSELDAWLAFLSSDSPKVICTLIEQKKEEEENEHLTRLVEELLEKLAQAESKR